MGFVSKACSRSMLAAAFLASSPILLTTAQADIIGPSVNITYNGTNGPTLSSYGTISVSGDGTTTITVDVDLASNYYFFSSGNGTTFQFSVSGATVTAASVTSTTATDGATWAFVPTASTSVNPLDSLGNFLY